MSAQGLCLICTTVPDATTATKLAHAMIEKCLVACAQISAPMTSIYRWKGKLTEESEVVLVLKAPQRNYLRIESFLNAAHPYEVPEIIAVPVCAASMAYRDWVMTGCTREDAGES